MKLTAQRNITIEFFETGREDVVLVGTLADHEHLIKLELTIHLPDEQITQSRASMIRVPFPVCHEIESIAERLVGLRIERGVLTEIDRRVGGSAGCSHVKELATGVMHFAASFLVGRRAGVEPLTTEFTHTPPEERFDRFTRVARRMFGVPIALVSLVDADRQWFKSRQGLEATETRRRELQARRVVPDREIMARFPRLMVPTYSGDQQWFDSEAFHGLLPRDWPLERRRLDQVIHPGLLGG